MLGVVMTLVLGLRLASGVVLASDSQVTRDHLREPSPKLFATPPGLIWGSAGDYSATQVLWDEMNKLEVSERPGREEAREAIKSTVVRAAKVSAPEGTTPAELGGRLQALVAWHGEDGRPYLLKATGSGQAEFATTRAAIGSAPELGRFAVFAIGLSEHLDLPSLPLETGTWIALLAADDTIRLSARGLDGPVQLAQVSAEGAARLSDEDRRPIEHTAALFRELQREFLVREDRETTKADTGVRPATES